MTTLSHDQVLAYDSSGNHLVPTHIRVGDKIDYKKNGCRGAFQCIVIAKGDSRIKVLPVSHDGIKLDGKPIWISRTAGILRVYPQ